MDNETIQRIEKKYLLTRQEKTELLSSIKKYLEKDEFFSEQVLSLYFDTKNNDLIINSIDRPPFREKLRLRAYGIPKKSSKVFLELKSKLVKGSRKIGNKRRLNILLSDFYKFTDKKEKLTSIIKKYPDCSENQIQIAKELDYLFDYYEPEPKIIISANRLAYYEKNNPDFRLTFDENLRYREDKLFLEKGSSGKSYFSNTSDPKRCIIMEVKTINSMPLWLVRELSRLKIYPVRFSKYGKIYQQLNERTKNV